MKLLNKTQWYYLLLVGILLAVWTGVFLYVISSVIQSGIDETLKSQMQSSISRMKSQSLSYFTSFGQENPLIQITVIDSIESRGATFTDTTLYNSVEGERIPYRQISAEFRLGGKPVKMIMRKSTVEYDDLFYAILFTELLFVVILIIVFYLINRLLLQRLWAPFFGTLRKVSRYQISEDKSLELAVTNIDEFSKLNEVLMQMTERIEQEYQSLKQFTENASHEIQTPLSLIINHAEMLMQNERYSARQRKSIAEIYRAAHRLSRLNRAMLLLTKIENRQFVEQERVHISRLITKLLKDYSEERKQKNIKLRMDIKDKIIVNSNRELMELLLRNVLTNAIKHNLRGGEIHVKLCNNQCIIENTGTPPKEDPGRYFERFHKADAGSSSLGIGLALVNKICKVNKFRCRYTFEDHLHKLKIIFGEQ